MNKRAALESRMKTLTAARLKGMLRGIEKESLRTRADGKLATTPHPAALGSPLTHPHITTDFSESQLELITGARTSVDAMLEELVHIHQVVYRAMAASADEILWCASMPCGLPPDDEIPLGRYGSSNVGRAKTVYRMGLGYRYGRRMQTISGIHYNWSLPGLSNEEYFALLRNFRRTGWLLFYLFGASPAVCETFIAGNPQHGLQRLRAGTMYLPYATSLRMGRLGYQSDAQSSLAVSYNSLAEYAASLHDALVKPYPPYEKIGLRDEKGGYKQLATSLLQIENEFYSKIRPKRRIHPNERPLHALRSRGVEYMEVRLMDLDPFAAIGISAPVCRFLDVFLLHCLLADSPPDTPAEIAAMARNNERVATRGREPGLRVERGDGEVAMKEWGAELLAECLPLAERLDAVLGGGAYRDAVAAALAALEDPDKVPSARVLHAMQRNHDGVYVRFVLSESLLHRSALLNLPLPSNVEEEFAQLARASAAKQRQMEAHDRVDFETWRQNYLDPASLNP
jgi:glutamate--cysteine ligase